MDVQKAIGSQLANIESRYGRSLADLSEALVTSGKERHSDLVAYAKEALGMSHGDANTLTHYLRGNLADEAAAGDPLDTIYVGPKAALRPIHDALAAALADFGDYETAPKKGYVSLRRKKQFAMVGPATNTKVEVGLNVKGLTGAERLVEQAPGGMCQYKVRLGDASEVDDELLGWLRAAYDAAG